MSSFRRPASGVSVAVVLAPVVAGAVCGDAFFADDFRHIDNADTPAADAGECAADNVFQADRHQAC